MLEWLGEITNNTIDLIESVQPFYAYLAITLSSFFENIFPPAPGDIITVFGASLVGTGHLSFFWVLVTSTIGSVLGFMTYFFVGQRLGRRFFVDKNYSFFPESQFIKTEEWFEKYGYKIVIANRFLSGLRSVISIFCGVSQLNFKKILIYSTISALAWNFILISLGATLGSNWQSIQIYLKQYAQIILILLAVITLFFIIRSRFIKKA